MLFDDVWQHLEEGSNVLLYKQNIYQLFSENKGASSWAYVSNPKKGKAAISDIVKVLVPGRVVKSLSVAELLDIINDYARESEDMVVLWVDNFERLNKRTLEYYVELVSMGNVYLVCNIVAEDEEFNLISLTRFGKLFHPIFFTKSHGDRFLHDLLAGRNRKKLTLY